MSRRHQHHEEEHENHERWLVSYADFITLMFAFFVVMYALSQVNESKYKILSDSLVDAFHAVKPGNPEEKIVVDAAVLKQLVQTPQEIQTERLRGSAREKMRNMAWEIQRALAPLVQEGKVRITEGPQGISVEINASVLFASGEAQLGASAVAVLRTVAHLLADTDYPITVEGHTDNSPISTVLFPSNWELSVVRATSVVRLFQESGVAPWRLTATGYGEQRPVASNDTVEGKARNRRVNVTIDALVGPAPVAVPLAPAVGDASAPAQPTGVAPAVAEAGVPPAGVSQPPVAVQQAYPGSAKP